MKRYLLLFLSILCICLCSVPSVSIVADTQTTVLLDNCDTFANQQTVKYVDYDEFIEGNASLRSLVSLNPSIKLSLDADVSSIDLSNAYLNFYFYVDNAIFCNGNAKVTLKTENGVYTSGVIKNAKSGWNFYSLKIADMTSSSSDWGKVTGFEVEYHCVITQGFFDTKTDTFIRLDNLFISKGSKTVSEIIVQKGTLSDMPVVTA